jgi:hypothetical protein
LLATDAIAAELGLDVPQLESASTADTVRASVAARAHLGLPVREPQAACTDCDAPVFGAREAKENNSEQNSSGSAAAVSLAATDEQQQQHPAARGQAHIREGEETAGQALGDSAASSHGDHSGERGNGCHAVSPHARKLTVIGTMRRRLAELSAERDRLYRCA